MGFSTAMKRVFFGVTITLLSSRFAYLLNSPTEAAILDPMSTVTDLRARLSPLEEASDELRLKMMRDAKTAWNALVGLASYGLNEDVQLAAQKVVLAYTIGLPVQRVETKDTTARGQLRDLSKASDAELKALKTLREADRQREEDDSGIVD